MTTPSFGTALRQWLYGLDETTVHRTDAELLQRFRAERDEAAFARLVQRHGPMVLNLCRRLLRNTHDADDAFQATFLVLACRAGSIRRVESLASFLHGTAYRIAHRLRAQMARRQTEQRQAASQRPEAVLPPEDDGETHALLHEELHRLPRKYRDVLILCYLQGKTHEEAAHELGYPLGSMSRHLSRARELLRQRLTARGVGAGVLALSGTEPVRAAVASALLCGTLDTVRRHALASALLAGTSPPVAVILAQGILRAATPLRWLAASLVLTVGLVFAGGMVALRTPAEKEAPAEAKRQDELPGKEQPRLDLYGDPLPEGALARIGSVRLRHRGAMQVAFTAESKTLLTAGKDDALCFWDAETGKLQRVQRTPLPTDWTPDAYPLLTLSPDGTVLARATPSHLYLWSIREGKELYRLARDPRDGIATIAFVTFSPSGKFLAESDYQNRVTLWDVRAGKKLRCLKHESHNLPPIAFAPDDKIVATAGNGFVLLWNLADGKLLRTIKRPPQSLGCSYTLGFSPDGRFLVHAAYNRVDLWRTATGAEEAAFDFGTKGEKNGGYFAAFAPDGKTLALGIDDRILLWDCQTRKEIKRMAGYHAYDAFCFSPNGTRLASLHSGKVHLWDVAAGKRIQNRPNHDGEVACIAFSPDGRLVASGATGGEHPVRLWNARTGALLRDLPASSLGHVHQLLFSTDGTTLLAGGEGWERRGIGRIDINTILTWNVSSGKAGHAFRLPESGDYPREKIQALHLSPDGKRLTARSYQFGDPPNGGNECLTTWDMSDGKRLSWRSEAAGWGHHEEIFSPDGTAILMRDIWGLVLHPLVEGQKPRILMRGDYYPPSAFSADGQMLAVGGRLLAFDWQATEPGATAQQRKTFAERVRLVDVPSGEERLRIETGPVYWRAFTPDGRYLAATAKDRLGLWETATGQEVLSEGKHETPLGFSGVDFANCLCIAPDGRSAATGHSNSEILLWDLVPALRRPRRLTADDCGRLWNALTSDAASAYRALGTLIADPERAVPFLGERLQPMKEDAPRIRQLLADLDSDAFAVREAARRRLQEMGDVAHARLRQALREKPSLELRRNIEMLLSRPRQLSPQELRRIRAITVLEQIGDAEAQRMLQRLAEGTAEARQTREARAALQRLDARR